MNEDRWIWKAISERPTEDSDPIETLVVAGLLGRLAEETKAVRQMQVEALLAGRRDSTLFPIESWASTLTKDFVRRAEDVAICWVDRLADTLRELSDELDPEDPIWHRMMCHLLVDRDDLEGVLVVSEMSSHASGRLRSALRRLDDQGEIAIRALPVVEIADEDVREQLERASLLDHEYWWVRPVFHARPEFWDHGRDE